MGFFILLVHDSHFCYYCSSMIRPVLNQAGPSENILSRLFVTPPDVIPTQDVIIAARCNTIYARCSKYANCNNFLRKM